MNETNNFDGFTVTIFLDEDKQWLAYFEELPSISAFANTPEEALQELKTAWELVKQSCIEDGDPIPVAPSQKQYSGQFNVRIDKRLHKNLAIEAAKAGISLNALVAQKLAQGSENQL